MNSFVNHELLRRKDYDLKSIILTGTFIIGIELLFMFGMAIIITCVRAALTLIGVIL